MPYGYYQLVRFVAFAGFGVIAYLAYKDKREWEVIVSVVLALLFQPFMKLALGREVWTGVDVVVAVYLLVVVFRGGSAGGR